MSSFAQSGSTFNAGFWILVSQGGTQLLRLLTSILLTRLLSPDAFGLIAIAMTLIVAIHMISDLGLRQVIVTNEQARTPLFLDTIWALQILRGICVFAVVLVGAVGLMLSTTWISSSNFGIYSDPHLPGVLAALSLSAIILGFEPTGASVAVRDTNLGRVAAIDILTQLISALLTLIIAYFYRSVWPLVLGNLIGACARVLLSRQFFDDHVNSFRMNRKYVVEIFSYSKWIFASSAMGFVVNHADKLAFSLFMSATKFGTVVIAISLTSVVLDTINRLVDNVVFPKLSQAATSGSVASLATVFLQFRFWLEATVLFLIAFLWFASGSIVQLLFDHRYESAASFLRVLSITLIWPIAVCCSSLGLAMGKPSLLATITWIRLVLTIVLPLPIYKYYGDIGVAWALVFAQVPAVLYGMIGARRLLGQTGLNFKRLVVWLFLPLGGLVGSLFSLALR